MKCKRLCAWLLSLVMMFSLLPVSAAAAGTDVGSKAYDEIRIYLDAETKTDFDNLEGTLTKQVRIISPEYSGGDTLCFHNIEKTYWYAPNIIRKVTANDITRIDLVRDKALGHSSKIQIPIGGNEIYKVTISEGGSAKFLRIDITKRTPHAVKYVFASPAPETVPAPVDPAKYTETSSVTLLDPAEKSVTGTHEGRTGLWTFDGWTVKGDQTNTQISQADKKFIMPDEDVTVTGTWTFEATPPTGTPVYVYFQTVNTAGKPIGDKDNENVKDVKHNENGNGWATLGKLTTEQPVSASTDKTEVGKLGKEVKKTNDKFEEYLPNENLNLDLIKWVELKQDNGAADYVKPGTNAWHLNGKVTAYRAIYCDSKGNELANFTPNQAPKYYLKGAANIGVSTEEPATVPDGKEFDRWVTNDEDVTVKNDTFIMPDHDVKFTPKWKPITADLIDNDITIKHGVNAAPADGDDPTAHIVNKDAKISYQATLDMQSLKFGANPEHKTAVSFIEKQIGTGSLWGFMEGKNITTFAGSKVNLHVKFSDKLENPATLNGITLKSGWFKLDRKTTPTYDKATGYWTIPCVIKDATDAPDIDTNDSIVTLSGITLPLTADAQDELRSDTALDITSGGYIDGTIKIYTYELSLIGKSKEAPAENTAKLKLDVPTYTVTYDANGGSGTMTDKNSPYAYGAAATVLTNGFTRSRYTFTGWNTEADGSGKSYAEGDPIKMLRNVVLYAQWTRNSSHDDDDKYFFAIQKVDAQDGHALNGAKFELYQLDKNDRIKNRRVVETRQQSSKNGIALFGVDNKNSYDGIWYYAEVSAPEGYVLDRTEYEINDKDFSDSLSTAVKYADTVRNYRGTTPDLLNDSDHFAYVIGYMDGNVRPYGLISRAETTTIFFRLLKDSVRDGNLLTSNTYTDVADDYWANTAISTMTGLGIVQGRSTTTFDPKAPITRAQFAAICARFDTGKSNGEQTFSDIQGHWAEKYIQRAAELGWIKGFEDGTFRPDTYITRAQAMTMINRVLNRIPEDESDLLPGMNVWPDCNPGNWFYLTVQEATNSHDFKHKAGSYETWTGMNKDPDWTRYEN